MSDSSWGGIGGMFIDHCEITDSEMRLVLAEKTTIHGPLDGKKPERQKCQRSADVMIVRKRGGSDSLGRLCVMNSYDSERRLT